MEGPILAMECPFGFLGMEALEKERHRTHVSLYINNKTVFLSSDEAIPKLIDFSHAAVAKDGEEPPVSSRRRRGQRPRGILKSFFTTDGPKKNNGNQWEALGADVDRIDTM